MQNNALSEKQYLSAKKKFHTTKVGRPVAPKLVMCFVFHDDIGVFVTVFG
jgi:hypothetical protein